MNDGILIGGDENDVPQKTHVAVALQYNPAEDKAPKVVASGKGAVADQILNLAFQHGVKVREDAELVEILSLLDVDCPIPVEAFAVVAEILTHVYRANAMYKQRQLKGQP